MLGSFVYHFPAGSNHCYVLTHEQLARYFAQDGRCGDCNVRLNPLDLIDLTADSMPDVLICALCAHRLKRVSLLSSI